MRGPLLTFVWSVIYPFAVAVHAQRGAVADPMTLITSMCSNGASNPWSSLSPAGSDLSPDGIPYLTPLAGKATPAEHLLRLSDVPESAIDPDSASGTPLRWQGALSTLEESRDSVHLYHHTVIADRHVLAGNPAAALDHLDAALIQDPLNQALLERAARAASLAGQVRRCRLYWDVLANLNARTPRVLYERVLAECREERLDEARMHLVSARAAFPGHIGLRLLEIALAPEADPAPLGHLSIPDMAEMLREWHQRRESLAFLPARRYIRVARHMMSGGSPVAENDQASTDPSYWARTCALASRYLAESEFALRNRRWDRLLAALDGAEKIGVDGPWMILFRAETLLVAGRRAEGEPLIERALQRFGNDDRVAFDAARMYLDLGRASESLALFNQALRLDRSNPDYRFGLACALTAAGQGAAGLVHARTLQAENPARMAEWLAGDKPYVRELRDRLR